MAKELQEVIAILVGDAHLSDRSFLSRSDMLGDPQYAMQQAIDHACSISTVQYLIAAGDLFDSKKPSSEVSLSFRRMLAELSTHGIRFGYIRGNHDFCNVPWPKAISAKAVHLQHKKLALETSGRPITVYGMDYTPVDTLQAEIDKIPDGVDVLICHQRWDEFAGGCGDGSLSLIPRHKVSTVFTGDTHLAKQFMDTGKRIISPGATHMRKSDEPAKHFIYELLADGSIKAVPLRSRAVLRYEITSQGELESFLDNVQHRITALAAEESKLPPQLQKPIVVVRLEYLLNKAKRRVEAVCKGKAHLFWSSPKSRDEELPAESKVTGSTDFLSVLNEECEAKSVRALITRLWNATDMRREFEQIKRERGLCD